MYHILPPDGQAQFGTRETIYDEGLKTPGESTKLSLAVGRPVAGLDQTCEARAARKSSGDTVESEHKLARTPRQAKIAGHSCHQQLFDSLGKIGWSMNGRMRRTGKMVSHNGAFKGFAPGRDPHSAARQFCGQVGYHNSLRVDHETYEASIAMRFARDDAAALAAADRSFRIAQGRLSRHASCCSICSGASASGASGAGGSIQPAFTRASMMMALASSCVRLKPSSAPGTRTRSFSLFVS